MAFSEAAVAKAKMTPHPDSWYTLSTALYICLRLEADTYVEAMAALKAAVDKHPEIDFGEIHQWADWEARL